MSGTVERVVSDCDSVSLGSLWVWTDSDGYGRYYPSRRQAVKAMNEAASDSDALFPSVSVSVPVPVQAPLFGSVD